MRCAGDGAWATEGLRRAVDVLADAWLHRVLWLRRRELAAGDPQLSRYWWAPQAPEPSTLAAWLPDATRPFGDTMPPQPPGGELRILHPDPRLAGDERQVLRQRVCLAGYCGLAWLRLWGLAAPPQRPSAAEGPWGDKRDDDRWVGAA